MRWKEGGEGMVVVVGGGRWMRAGRHSSLWIILVFFTANLNDCCCVLERSIKKSWFTKFTFIYFKQYDNILHLLRMPCNNIHYYLKSILICFHCHSSIVNCVSNLYANVKQLTNIYCLLKLLCWWLFMEFHIQKLHPKA